MRMEHHRSDAARSEVTTRLLLSYLCKPIPIAHLNKLTAQSLDHPKKLEFNLETSDDFCCAEAAKKYDLDVSCKQKCCDC